MKSRHVQIGLLFIGICVLIGLGLALATFKQQDRPPAAGPAPMTTNTAPPVIATEAPAAAVTLSVRSDFLVTDELRSHPPSATALAGRTKIATFCQGTQLTLANSSTRPLRLDVIAPNSDGAAKLGTVQPAATLTFDAGVAGDPEDNRSTLVDADTGKGLFEYIIADCKSGAAPDAPSASSTNMQTVDDGYRPGRCRLVVGGRTIIDGSCSYQDDGQGNIDMMSKSDGSGYRAMIQRDGPDAKGYWSGRRGSNQAFDELGIMVQSGPCWKNDAAEICAWPT